MGKKTKEHNKKVAKRNAKIAEEKKRFQKQYTQMLEQKLKEYQSKLTEKEQLENEMKVTLGGQDLNFSVFDPSELETPITEENQ
jgi:hypothetical protein